MSQSERRQIENEMIFRQGNEKVAEALDNLDEMLIEDGNPELIRTDDIVLHFKCECSDENCEARIPMKLSTYQEIHKNRKAFVIKPKHQVKDIEKTIQENDKYYVVEKNKTAPEPSGGLNSTSVDNS